MDAAAIQQLIADAIAADCARQLANPPPATVAAVSVKLPDF